jgi:SAM-dependent methyltransferase
MMRRLKNSCLKSLLAALDLPRARAHLLSGGGLSPEQRELLQRVSLRIHSHDGMYVPFRGEHYLRVGLSALTCIEQALRASAAHRRNGAVQTVLDLPCGHGRVLRFLRQRFPDARIVAMETDASGLEFCARRLGASPSPSRADFGALSLPDRFDLIWCGSLITHLNEATTVSLLRFFFGHLREGGVCVFTTHGAFAAELVRTGAATYGLASGARQALLAQHADSGLGFAAYAGERDYGVSLASGDRVRALAAAAGDWRETLFLERGWDNHQDVYAFCRTAEPAAQR